MYYEWLGLVIVAVIYGLVWLDTKKDPLLGKDRSSHRAGRTEDDCV